MSDTPLLDELESGTWPMVPIRIIKSKYTFTGKAIEVGRHIGENEIVKETGVWTDGIGLFSDHAELCSYCLEKGKTYRVTVEEITKGA